MKHLILGSLISLLAVAPAFAQSGSPASAAPSSVGTGAASTMSGTGATAEDPAAHSTGTRKSTKSSRKDIQRMEDSNSARKDMNVNSGPASRTETTTTTDEVED